MDVPAPLLPKVLQFSLELRNLVLQQVSRNVTATRHGQLLEPISIALTDTMQVVVLSIKHHTIRLHRARASPLIPLLSLVAAGLSPAETMEAVDTIRRHSNARLGLPDFLVADDSAALEQAVLVLAGAVVPAEEVLLAAFLRHELARLHGGVALGDGVGDGGGVAGDGHGAHVVVDVFEEEGAALAAGVDVGVDVVGGDEAAECGQSSDDGDFG